MTETPLPERVENGIRWLAAHDPTGSFHLWFGAGISPVTKMPVQTTERLAEYAIYFKARSQWEQLFAKMEREEAASAKALGRIVDKSSLPEACEPTRSLL